MSPKFEIGELVKRNWFNKYEESSSLKEPLLAENGQLAIVIEHYKDFDLYKVYLQERCVFCHWAGCFILKA